MFSSEELALQEASDAVTNLLVQYAYAFYRSYIMKEYDRIQYTNDKFAEAVYEEFRHGKDRVGDSVCENATEYWNCYLTQVVYPEMETYREETVLPLLEEAKLFYEASFSDIPEAEN